MDREQFSLSGFEIGFGAYTETNTYTEGDAEFTIVLGSFDPLIFFDLKEVVEYSASRSVSSWDKLG